MAETSHEIRREVEVTRERVGDTIAALERKVNPKHVLEDYPLAALGVAFGVGVLIGTTGAGGRAVRTVRSQVRSSAHTVNGSAGTAIDRILHGIMAAATTAGTAKLTTLLEDVVSKYVESPATGGRGDKVPSRINGTARTVTQFADSHAPAGSL